MNNDSVVENDIKPQQRVWLRSRSTRCTGKNISTEQPTTSDAGNAQGTVEEKNLKSYEDESTCNDHECWIVASKETEQSDLKLCLQKTGSSQVPSPPATVQKRKRGRPKKQHVPQQMIGGGSEVQSNKVIPRSKSTQRRVIKPRISYAKKQQQLKKTTLKIKNVPKKLHLTTEEDATFPKKRKIIQKKKTARLKTEVDCAVENLSGDVFYEPDDISNCCVLISDVMMYNKETYIADVSDNVVTETSTPCGDVEMLIPESITYLQNQFPKSPIHILETGDESQEFRYEEPMGSPTYETFDVDRREVLCSNMSDEPKYQQIHGSAFETEYMETTESVEIGSIIESSQLNDSENFVSLQSGVQTRSIETFNYDQQRLDEMIDLTSVSLSENNKVTENFLEYQSSGSRSNQASVEPNYDCFGNVLVTNIIICPADMYVLDGVNNEPQGEAGIQYLIDKELREVISCQTTQDTDNGNNFVKDCVVKENANCGNDVNDCSSGKTPNYYINTDRDILTTDKESNCCENDFHNVVNSGKGRGMATADENNVVDFTGDPAADFSGGVYSSSDTKDCVHDNDQCKVTKDSQNCSCAEETSNDPDASRKHDTANDSLTVESPSESKCEILKSTAKFFSLSLLQEYSSDESDDDDSCSEAVSTNNDSDDGNDATEPTEQRSKCEGEKKNDNDCNLDDNLDDNLDRLSLYCDSSDFFLSDDEDSPKRENPNKDVSNVFPTKTDADQKDINKETAKEQTSVQSVTTSSISKDTVKPRQAVPPSKPVRLPYNSPHFTRRVIDVRSRASFAPFTTLGLPARPGLPLINQIPPHSPLSDCHQKYNYPGKFFPDRFFKPSPVYIDSQNAQIPLVQQGCEWKTPRYDSYRVQDEFHSSRRVVVRSGPRQLILDLVGKGMLVQAWMEIVRYGLFQQIDIKCIENMATSGCMMKSDNAWQMVLEILEELKYCITYNFPGLCLKLIKLLCDNRNINRAMAVFDYIPFPLNGLVAMDILDQLLDGLLSTSRWKTARRVIGQLLHTGLRPQECALRKIMHKYYDDFDSQSIFDLLKQLKDSAMQRTHPIYQDALRLLRRLLLNTRGDDQDGLVQRSSEQMQLMKPQNIKELVNAIWDCPNGLHAGRMCTHFFEEWSMDACCNPVLQQQLCSYLTRMPRFQAEIFADFISELDKACKTSRAVREACRDLLNGLLLEALALDDKALAVRIIFPAMESHFIPIYDKGLASLIDLIWNAGTEARATARRLFGLRCQGGFLCNPKVAPFEVLIQASSTTAEIFFMIEKLLFLHKRVYNQRSCFYNVKVIIQHSSRSKRFSRVKEHDCIDRVKHVLDEVFQPSLKILRMYESTNSTSQDVIIVAYNSVYNWLQSEGKLLKHCRPYSNRQK